MVQGPCGEGPWGAYGEGVTERRHMEQHTVQPAVPEKASLGGKLYHVTMSLKPQMLSLMAEKKKKPKKEQKFPFKKSNMGYCYISCQLIMIFPFSLLNLMKDLYSVTLGPASEMQTWEEGTYEKMSLFLFAVQFSKCKYL